MRETHNSHISIHDYQLSRNIKAKLHRVDSDNGNCKCQPNILIRSSRYISSKMSNEQHRIVGYLVQSVKRMTLDWATG